MSTLKKVLAAIALVLLCTASALSVSADEYMIIDDFGENDSGISWTAADADCRIDKVRSGNEAYLELSAFSVQSDRIITAVGTFEEARDLSAYRAIKMRIKVVPLPDGESKICYARITLYDSELASIESITSVRAGEWSEITLDISDFDGKDSICAVEVGVIPDRVSTGIWDGGFCIDDISAHGSADAGKAERFMFEDFECDGATVSFDENMTSFSVIPDGAHTSAVFMFTPEAYIPPFSNALRFRLENHTDSEFVKVFLTYSDGGLRETGFETTPRSEAKIYYLNDENAARIVGITLEFENTPGSYIIHSITSASVYDKNSGTVYGKIETCRYDEESGMITVSGTVPREYVSENADSELLLYALELNENTDKYVFDRENALAIHGMSTKFRFVLNVGEHNPEEIYKKYVVVTDDTVPKLIDTPSYVSFGEAETGATERFAVGIIADSDAAVGTEFAKATVIDVALDRLLSAERSGYIHENIGGYYYFDREYTDELDRRISALSDAGVGITLRLEVSGEAIPELLYSGAGNRFSKGYFLNIHNEQGYDLLRASVGFLSSRYKAGSRGGKIDGYIVGNAVNAVPPQNGAPLMSVTEHAESYSDIMRLVSTSSKAVGYPVRVYASLGDVYEYELLAQNENIYDTLLYMEALKEYICDEGEFDYGICVEELESLWRYGNEASHPEEEAFFAPAQSASTSQSVIIIDRVSKRALESEPETANRASRAEKNGFSGRYIYRLETETLSELVWMLKNLSVGTATERTVKPTLGGLDSDYVGTYLYYGFGSYEGIGNWCASYNAKEVNVKNAELFGQLERSNDNYAEPMGIGCSFGYPNDFSLTPYLSLDLLVDKGDSTGETADIVVRFIGDGAVFDSTAELVYGEKQTLYIDFSGVEAHGGFTSVQILLYDSLASDAQIYADNICGYSAKYDDSELAEKISLLRLGGDVAQSNDMTVILIFISLLAVLITVTIMVVLFGKKRNE